MREAMKAVGISVLCFLFLLGGIFVVKFIFAVPGLPVLWVGSLVWFSFFKLLPKLGMSRRASALFVTAFLAAWLFGRNWLLNNVAAVAILSFLLVYLPHNYHHLSVVKVVVAICVGAVFYDLFAVFVLEVMKEVALRARAYNLPLFLEVPRHPLRWWSEPLFSLGLGDVFLPLLLARVIVRRVQPLLKRVAAIILAASYAAGLGAALAVMAASGLPQPALIYLIPALLVGWGVIGIVDLIKRRDHNGKIAVVHSICD